jgi:hypothetical protein
MRQFHSLSIVSFLSLSSAIAFAGPPEPSAPSTQGQSLDGRTQQQGQDTQSQTNPPSAPPQGPWGAPTIEVNPQIQVQVNPDLDVQANPQADADAKADAKADAQANPNAEAKAEIDSDIASENAEPSAAPAEASPEPAPPVTHVEVIHRPVPSVPPPRVVRKPHRRSGLMVAGMFTFGASYIGTALNGAYLYDQCDRASDPGACRQMSTKMLIPVAGPFMAIHDSDVRSNQVKLGMLGGIQAAGALMTVAGTVMHIRDGRKERFIDPNGVRIGKQTRIAPMTGRGAGGVHLHVRF